MDLVTYALLKGEVSGLKAEVEGISDGFTYKGSASSTSALPSGASKGDMYTVAGVKYVWDGSNWVKVSVGDITAADVAYNGSTVYSSGTVGNKLASLDSSVSGLDSGKVPTSRTVNGKALSSNVTLTPGDIAYDGTATYAAGSVGAKVSSIDGTVTAQSEAIVNFNPLNIQGVTVADGTNLMPSGEVKLGGYYYSSNDVLTWKDSASFNAVKIPATQGTYKSNNNIRFTVVTDANDNILYYSGSNITSFTAPSGTAFIYASVSTSLWDTFMVSKGTATPTTTKYNWDKLQTVGNQVADKLYGVGFSKITGTLADTEYLLLPRTNCVKNNVYVFKCNITTLGKITIGHGSGTYGSSYIEIDDTNVVKHIYTNIDTPETFVHGLTISGYLYVMILVKIGKADITLLSNGQTYKITNTDWTGTANGNTYVHSDGSTLTDCVFTWASQDFRKSVWMYGDSYLGMTSDNRWCYYLSENGYGDNAMINAFPGEDSNAAWTAITNGLNNYGKPKTIIWCMGMNDGSDADANTPSTQWLNRITGMLQLCESYGITPILATIPTVPSINHEGKNKYVRESGYRYIDFASAVGAQSNGTWYTGMLSSDNVHPTEIGAFALFNQAMLDAPELTFSNP